MYRAMSKKKKKKIPAFIQINYKGIFCLFVVVVVVVFALGYCAPPNVYIRIISIHLYFNVMLF